MFKGHFWRATLVLLILACAGQTAHADVGRVHALSTKVKCDCGCGDVLAECGHVECTRRPALKQEISDAVLRGQSDDQVLQQLVKAHGSAVLVTPMFRGFDMMLWIVPVILGLSVLGGVVYRFRSVGQGRENR